MKNRTRDAVAEYFDKICKASSKSDAEIARAIGFDESRATYVSAIRKGDAKLPINMVIPLTKALGSDSYELLLLCLRTYAPDTARVVEALMQKRR